MRILIVDDHRGARITTAQAAKAVGHEVAMAENGPQALLKLQGERFDLVVLDLNLEGEADGLDCLGKLQKISPGLAVVISTAHASVDTAIEAMRRGAIDYIRKPFTPDQLRIVLARVEGAQRMRRRADGLVDRIARAAPPTDFVAEDPAMKSVVDIAERAATTRTTILILGENGTGKSLLARHVHSLSLVADGPFVTVSCPNLSRELLESDLFGHVQGAFTGAVKDCWGKVEAARGGTLFFDEIGELPLELQPKLLRLLQERAYERVGETKTHSTDVRVIAASNRDLAAAVKEGKFREDLFYRLNVITVTIPPLRERPAGLVRLAESFLRFCAGESGGAVREFSEPAWEAIRAHSWPGNLRELRNAIERGVILARGERIEREDLPAELAQLPGTTPELGGLVSLEALEEAHIRRVIGRTAKLEDAARVLGLDIATLYRKRKRWAAAAAESATAGSMAASKAVG